MASMLEVPEITRFSCVYVSGDTASVMLRISATLYSYDSRKHYYDTMLDAKHEQEKNYNPIGSTVLRNSEYNI